MQLSRGMRGQRLLAASCANTSTFGRREREICGVRIRPLTRTGALSGIERALTSGQRLNVSFANAHTLNIASANDEFRAVLKNFSSERRRRGQHCQPIQVWAALRSQPQRHGLRSRLSRVHSPSLADLPRRNFRCCRQQGRRTVARTLPAPRAGRLPQRLLCRRSRSRGDLPPDPRRVGRLCACRHGQSAARALD